MARTKYVAPLMQGDLVHLECNRCRSVLTRVLRVERDDDQASSRIDFVDNKCTIRAGVAHLSNKPIQQGDTLLDFVPQYWLNPNDLTDQVALTLDTKRLNGCCGYDGCDGPNQICVVCSADIGTLQNDCWTSIQFIVQPETTRWVRQPE